MKISIAAILVSLLLHSCNDHHAKTPTEPASIVVEKQRFFPVTDYIKGQLFELNKRGINPLKYHTVNNRTDSSWLKLEDIPRAVDEFLHPEIDSVNLVSLFTEKKFMDQSIDAYTLTYDATGPLPDSMTLKHWDVYIDPATGNVRRIYMVKTVGESKTIQLTWQSNKWCKTTVLLNKPDGTTLIEKEEKITWDF